MSFSRPDPASPAQVADATFSTGRRGYDQGEVRDFLRMVSSELARLRERELFLERELRSAQNSPQLDAAHLDDEALTRLVGEETARVLNAARESANQIRDKAEQSAARILTEASDEAARRREEAEVEASRRRTDAATDAEAELAMAKQQGREMVNEARAYRERVLSELARRRELAREQIEQLVSGRDRLMQAFERARLVAVDVVAEMEPLGEPDEYVNLSPTTGPVPVMQARVGAPAAPESAAGDVSAVADVATLADVGDAHEATAETGDHTVGEGEREREGEIVVDESESDDSSDEAAAVRTDPYDHADETEAGTDDGADGADDGADGADVVADSADDTIEVAENTEDTVDTDGGDAAADGADTADETGDEVADAAETETAVDAETPAAENDDTASAPDGPVDIETSDDVEDDDGTADRRDDVVVDLFARLRHQAVDVDEADADADADELDDDDAVVDATENEATKVEETDQEPTNDAATDHVTAPAHDAGAAPDEPVSGAVPTTGTDDADPTEMVEPSEFEQRDADLTPLIVAAAKKLKRVLADEQNDVLDGLRRRDAVLELEAIIPSASEHTGRYLDAIRDDLLLAANAGAQIATPGRTGKLSKTSSRDAVAHAGTKLDEWLIGPLRERLARCVSDGHGDNTVITKKVRSAYREWKTQHIDEQLDDVMRTAHGCGVLEASEPGTGLRWATDPRHGSCPDCDDNALEPVVAAGDPFPTGHTFAPAHPGCRCMLLPAAP